MLLPVPRYEELYLFDYKENKVFSLDRIVIQKNGKSYKKPGRELSIYQGAYGHRYVDLYKDGVREKSSIHIITCEFFYGKKQIGMEVRHKDGNSSNNYPSNLEYGTHQENMVDRSLHGRHIGNIGNTGVKSKLSKIVLQYSLEGEFIGRHYGTMDVQRNYGFFADAISKCCNGKLSTAYGYIWKYE